MKLQKQVAYRYKGKTRYKFVIVIPNEAVEKLDWKVGQELDNRVERQTLTLKPKNGG